MRQRVMDRFGQMIWGWVGGHDRCVGAPDVNLLQYVCRETESGAIR